MSPKQVAFYTVLSVLGFGFGWMLVPDFADAPAFFGDIFDVALIAF